MIKITNDLFNPILNLKHKIMNDIRYACIFCFILNASLLFGLYFKI